MFFGKKLFVSNIKGYRCIHVHVDNPRAIKTEHRVGPHNKDVLEFLFGCIMADSSSQVRYGAARFYLSHYESQKDYVIWKRQFLAKQGYCSDQELKGKQKFSNLTQRYHTVYGFYTYSYQSFLFFDKMFYKENKIGQKKRIKVLPENEWLDLFLTPFAIAIWAGDDGMKAGDGFRFCTNNLTTDELKRLKDFLIEKYGLETTVQHHGGTKGQYRLYVVKDSMNTLKELIADYMPVSLLYKLNLDVKESSYFYLNLYI